MKKKNIVDWISTTLAIIFFVSTVILTIKIRKKKSLAYEIISETSLIHIEDQITSDVSVTYRGENVKNVHLIQVRILNNGNEHVSKEDFIKPITFEFNSQVKIMDMKADDKNPEDMQVTFHIEADNIVEVTPNLTNPGEWFVTKFLVAEYESFRLSTRIMGIKSLTEYKSPKAAFIDILIIPLIFLVCIPLSSVIWGILAPILSSNTQLLVAILMTTVGLVIIVGLRLKTGTFLLSKM